MAASVSPVLAIPSSTVMEHQEEELRPYLFAIAYRMLGSVADAEDVVQEAFLRYHVAEVEAESPKAYLATRHDAPRDRSPAHSACEARGLSRRVAAGAPRR
jgi:hypothetical protein